MSPRKKAKAPRKRPARPIPPPMPRATLATGERLYTSGQIADAARVALATVNAARDRGDIIPIATHTKRQIRLYTEDQLIHLCRMARAGRLRPGARHGNQNARKKPKTETQTKPADAPGASEENPPA